MGTTWTYHVLSDDAEGICIDIAIKPGNSDIMYAAGPPALHKTTDGGITWGTLTNGITGVIKAVTIDHHNNNVVYAGGDDGVFKTMNEGQTWTHKGLTDVNVLFMDPDDNDVIYTGTQIGLYKSSDGGETWNDENGGLEDLRVTAFGMAPDTYIFAGTEGGGMYRWEIVVGAEESTCPKEHMAFTILPNPVSDNTTITYLVQKETRVSLALYDVQGRWLRYIQDKMQSPGTYTIYWDGTDARGNDLATGVYFIRLGHDERSYVRKITVLSR